MRRDSAVTPLWAVLFSILSLAAGFGAYAAPPASLTSGANHTCAVAAFDDFVKCWGENGSYQAGGASYVDPTTVDRLKPGSVSTNPRYIPGGGMFVPDLKGEMVAAGRDHTCAVSMLGDIYCWGSNAYGQTGRDLTDTGAYAAPVHVEIPSDYVDYGGIKKIVAGRTHSCVLAKNLDWNRVLCWGRNSSGQLGNNSTANSSTPVLVSGLSDVVDIAAFGDHTCALRVGGTVKCWGYNGQGQLGNGTTTTSLVPVDVKLNSTTVLGGVSSIAAGSVHSCATLASNGKAMCWGNGTSGQLGNGTLVNSSYAKDVKYLSGTTPVSLTGATAVTAGYAHGCALLRNGKTMCWGDNSRGQIGDGTYTRRTTAVGVALPEARVVSAGDRHTCAILHHGGLRCWGYGGSGQLGRGTTADSPYPVTVQY